MAQKASYFVQPKSTAYFFYTHPKVIQGLFLFGGILLRWVNDFQITICDLSGTGVQDTMIADLSLKKAMERKMGSQIIASVT